MKKIILNLIAVLVLIFGISLFSYPYLSDLYSKYHQGKAIKEQNKEYDKLEDEEIKALFKKAEEYNETLLGQAELIDPFDPSIKNTKSYPYDNLLNISGNGLMGTVEIPSIGVNLPIYHGTSTDVLNKGAGHLQQTSLPVGGVNTHSVISAHTGSNIAKFFDNLRKVKEGEVFLIKVANRTMAYKINQIKIIKPSDTSDLHIMDGKDYVTLVTCTPYGVNSHRLLVRGERTEYIQGENKINQKLFSSDKIIFYIIAIINLIGLMMIVLHVLKRKERFVFVI
ncbi:MAG: class C sortase [Lachnospiraceae bacterium]|jgi:sortase A|nr:class C sortase [Lachnospiraceae bacterium]